MVEQPESSRPPYPDQIREKNWAVKISADHFQIRVISGKMGGQTDI
jgi:hypothetical protein